ncbi:MAG: helix-turn-helix domain-containing protein [Lachnospiraceae bacterium]|jgi:AraC family transcriptional regulator of arabinose operon|nr:helix-turn-helix domain-containing protein [Lachnospiraceae bacterium]
MGDINSLFSTTGITDSDRILHTPGEFARKNLLYVQEVGKLKSLQPHKSQRESLNSFLFLGVINGEGTIFTGEKSYKVKEGDCAFINCTNYYAHESSEDKPWELIWVHFSGHGAEEYFRLFMEQNEQKNVFKPDSIKEMQQYINELMNRQKEKDLEAELQSGELLLQLMNRCIISVIHQKDSGPDRFKTICKEIRESVNGKYRQTDLFAILAEKYEMGEEELDACFQKTYGITLRDYILNRRFTAAKELLRFTIKPVKEIVEESGIKNDDLFRRLFLDGEGMTAEEYRMKWAQWVK